jgi:anti-sigma B factor antagonist
MGVFFAEQFFSAENKRFGSFGKRSQSALPSGHKRFMNRDFPDCRLRDPDVILAVSGQQVNIDCGSRKQIRNCLRDNAGAGSDLASLQQLGRKCGEINRQNRILGRHGFGPEVTSKTRPKAAATELPLQIRKASSKLSDSSKGEPCCQRIARGLKHLTNGGFRVDIEVRSQGQVKIIKLRGRLSLGQPVDRLRDTIEDLLKAGDNHLILDLEELATMDSSGIGLLARFLTSAKQQGGSLKLLNPSKFVVQTLKLVGLLNLFEIFTDLPAAVASF